MSSFDFGKIHGYVYNPEAIAAVQMETPEFTFKQSFENVKKKG
jgi:hypothetical protein